MRNVTRVAAGTMIASFLLGVSAGKPAEPRLAATVDNVNVTKIASQGANDGRYLTAALDAAAWIRSTTIESPAGKAWPADPLDTGTVQTNLYTGTPGIVLFFIEAWHATGDDSFLDDAAAGADYLIDALERGGIAPGLYTGSAGIAFTLLETHRATGEERFHNAAMAAIEGLASSARPAGAGVEWIDSTDIISGTAGIGLFLLHAAEATDSSAALTAARQAGLRLIEIGDPADGGTSWKASSQMTYLLPNFSHGTAGIGYFLARLYEETGDGAFLEAALAGGRRLQAIADVVGDVCLILHDDDGGEDLFYLSWCHGPAGTGRTFYQLWKVTDDDEWLEWLDMSVNGILESGIPDSLTPGFWNNVGQCCGSAGVAEFFLDLHRLSGEPQQLLFARRVADNLISRGESNDAGLMWVQAEHRVQPDNLVAQTGYMQGAAGIGMLLLHVDGALTGREAAISLPDSPFYPASEAR